MSYLRNTSYLAAWSEYVQAGLMLSHRILREPIVLFRKDAGGIAALLRTYSMDNRVCRAKPTS